VDHARGLSALDPESKSRWLVNCTLALKELIILKYSKAHPYLLEKRYIFISITNWGEQFSWDYLENYILFLCSLLHVEGWSLIFMLETSFLFWFFLSTKNATTLSVLFFCGMMTVNFKEWMIHSVNFDIFLWLLIIEIYNKSNII